MAISISFAFPQGRILLLSEYTTPQRDSEQNCFFVARFFGLPVDILPVSGYSIDTATIKDPKGFVYPLCVISERALQMLDSTSIRILNQYATSGGSILVQDINDTSAANKHQNLRLLTHNRVWGVQFRGLPQHFIQFSSSAPGLTDVFTGFSFPTQTANAQAGYGLLCDSVPEMLPVFILHDTGGQPFSCFYRYTTGNGTIFTSSIQNRMQLQYLSSLYNRESGIQILPMMMIIKAVFGSRAWHSPEQYANLTIDDPPLANSGKFSYDALLIQMQAHRFHTTIAFIPQNYLLGRNQRAVEDLFRTYPQYFSLAQHGDFHTPYEFFGYTSEDSAALCHIYNYCGYPPVPLSMQEALIVDGLSKYLLFRRSLGEPDNRVMIFPYGISPGPTIDLLGKYGFASTVNSSTVPLLDTQDSSYDATARPSAESSHKFPLQYRRHPFVQDSTMNGSLLPEVLFDLFIGKPALLYSHIPNLFRTITNFNTIADTLNSLVHPVHWLSVDSISTQLYLEKTNDDGSDSIWVFGNRCSIKNPGPSLRTVHLFKTIDPQHPVLPQLAGGLPLPSRLFGQVLALDLTIAAGGATDILFLTRRAPMDFSITDGSARMNGTGIDIIVHNLSDSAGACPVMVADNATGALLGLQTGFIPAHDSGLVTVDNLPFLSRYNITLDPLHLTGDPDTSNNTILFVPAGRESDISVDNFDYADSPSNHGWKDVTPLAGGTASTMFDTTLRCHVFNLRSGNGLNFEYERNGTWQRTGSSMLIRTDSDFVIYYRCIDTNNNSIYFEYMSENGRTELQAPYLVRRIGTGWKDGKWHLFERDFNRDLDSAGWNTRVTTITGILFRGSITIAPINAGDNYPSVQTTSRIDEGWNMLSIPIMAAADSPSFFYPGALSQPFMYEGHYTALDSLSPGMGFWIKFSGADTVRYNGYPIVNQVVPVVQGWNLIGAASIPTAASDIESEPPGLVTGTFYGFGKYQYRPVDSLLPGHGYWVKATAPGKLILNPIAGLTKACTIQIVPDGEMPPEPPCSQESSPLPASFTVENPYPNPFNTSMTVRYYLPGASKVRITIDDLLGREVATIFSDIQGIGWRAATWDAGEAASGIYFMRISAVNISNPSEVHTSTAKIALIK